MQEQNQRSTQTLRFSVAVIVLWTSPTLTTFVGFDTLGHKIAHKVTSSSRIWPSSLGCLIREAVHRLGILFLMCREFERETQFSYVFGHCR